MAGDDRGPPRNLTIFQKLSAAPESFDFYQALREIECAFPDLPRIGEAKRPQQESVRFGQEASLAFATSSLVAFHAGANGRPPRLIESFFGLLGPNGPLPLHLTEYARERLRHHNDPTLVRFLDAFQHRFISLFYRAWARAQPTVALDRRERGRFSLYVGAFIGLAAPGLLERDLVPDWSKLSFAGLLGRQSRNAEGLEAILRGYFRVGVKVLPFMPHWMDLPEESYTRLNRREVALLGQTAVIGGRVWDLQTKFRIVLGPLTEEQYERFLPDKASYRCLADWIRNYVGFELKWECQLVLKREEVPAPVLGVSGKLGWTTWLWPRLSDRDADDLVMANR